MIEHSHGKDWVALTIALGLSTAVNIITAAVLIDALRNEGPGLSENATQVLTAVFGGMIGILGSYVGYRAGLRSAQTLDQPGLDDVEPSQEAPDPDQ